jgi:D-arabinose 5-phosphate isomerase GutQ
VKKNSDLTAEHAEAAEVITDSARPKDIIFSFSLSGAASRLIAFLCALSELCGEILLGMTSDFMKFHRRF